MAEKYSFIKRIVQAVPGLRESLVTTFTLLPKPLPGKNYDLMRRHVFRDNEPRLKIFNLAFEQVKKKDSKHANYFEFGVARGTNVIASYMIAHGKGMDASVYAFDSHKGFPSSEGDFGQGDMAYPKRVFKRFVANAGVPLDRVVCVPGFLTNH